MKTLKAAATTEIDITGMDDDWLSNYGVIFGDMLREVLAAKLPADVQKLFSEAHENFEFCMKQRKALESIQYAFRQRAFADTGVNGAVKKFRASLDRTHDSIHPVRQHFVYTMYKIHEKYVKSVKGNKRK